MSPHTRFLLAACGIGFAIVVLASLFASPLLRSSSAYPGDLHEVSSSAMSPTFELGTVVSIVPAGPVVAGDMVLVDVPTWHAVDQELLRRVVAVGGQRVDFRDGSVVVDGVIVDEPYLARGTVTEIDRDRPIPGCGDVDASGCLVPAGHLFVLGDNRPAAIDSRLNGPVSIAAVVGRLGHIAQQR